MIQDAQKKKNYIVEFSECEARSYVLVWMWFLIELLVEDINMWFYLHGSWKPVIFCCSKYSEGGKISIILVNSITLVDQHAKYVLNHTNFNVGQYTGDMNLDFWPKDKWYEEYDKHQVLIMTAQILLNIVTQHYIGKCVKFLFYCIPLDSSYSHTFNFVFLLQHSEFEWTLVGPLQKYGEHTYIQLL